MTGVLTLAADAAVPLPPRLWVGSAMVAVFLHAGALAAVAWRTDGEVPPSPPAGAMMIELAPAAVAPPAPAAQPKDVVREVAPRPRIRPQPRLPQATRAAATLPRPAVRPRDLPRREERMERAEAPSTPPAPEAAVPAAPVQGAAFAPVGDAVPTWQGALRAHLERHKRYPSSARFQRRQGAAAVRFVMDRDGLVLSARLESGSGSDALDEESLALLQRAQPLPLPPAEVPGDKIEVLVPIRFFLR